MEGLYRNMKRNLFSINSGRYDHKVVSSVGKHRGRCCGFNLKMDEELVTFDQVNINFSSRIQIYFKFDTLF